MYIIIYNRREDLCNSLWQIKNAELWFSIIILNKISEKNATMERTVLQMAANHICTKFFRLRFCIFVILRMKVSIIIP